MDVTEVQSLWDPNPGWLNTASYGLPPLQGWEAMQRALADWRIGATKWEPWGEATERARASFARLVGVDVADVFSGSTVSAAMALIAAAVPDGGTVLTPDVEFSSNVFPWAVHADRGITVRTAPPDQLAATLGESGGSGGSGEGGVDLVAVSAVQSSTGEVADLGAVVAAARRVGALVVVDATQAVGWLPVDAGAVDALVASTYKWLMSPRGATFGYLSPALRERCRPAQAGWYAGADVHASYYGLPMDLATDARRFDQSPAWFSHVAAAPTLELVERIGVPTIHDHNVALANRFRRGLGLPDSGSAIVSADIPGAEARLAEAGVRAAVRGGRLRASFHVYTTDADVDLALDALTG